MTEFWPLPFTVLIGAGLAALLIIFISYGVYPSNSLGWWQRRRLMARKFCTTCGQRRQMVRIADPSGAEFDPKSGRQFWTDYLAWDCPSYQYSSQDRLIHAHDIVGSVKRWEDKSGVDKASGRDVPSPK
jgi:hypothetical protein